MISIRRPRAFLKPLTLLAIIAAALPRPARAAPHDSDADADVDLRDYASLQRSLGRDDPAALTLHDTDHDGDVDGADFAQLEAAFLDPMTPPLRDAGPDSAGAPHPWERAVEISPASICNLATGNVLTTLALWHFEPVGPPLTFNLYHNSSLAYHALSGAAGQGFDLGPGWSTTGSARVLDHGDGTLTVVEDDGRQTLFRAGPGGVYHAPPGVHDRLVVLRDGAGHLTGWELVRVSQTRRVFNAAGRLVQVRDAFGSALTISRDPAHNDRIRWISSAAEGLPGVGEHRLTLEYDAAGRLIAVHAPGPATNRKWELTYVAGRLTRLRPPNAPAYAWLNYDTHGRIDAITSRANQTYHYRYEDARIAQVIDPAGDPNAPAPTLAAPLTPPPAPQDAVVQTFSPLAAIPGECLWRRTYVDRRGFEWHYDHTVTRDGRLLARSVDPLAHPRRYEYDGHLNLTSLTNELGNVWNFSWNPVGQLAALVTPPADPNAPRQTYTWTWQPVEPGPGNHYRLTRLTDPAGKWLEFEYSTAPAAQPDELVHPALPARVREQSPNGDPANESVADLRYYGSPSARGKFKRFTDQNGVSTEYRYDRWGYFAESEEGRIDDPPPGGAILSPNVKPGTLTRNSGGRVEVVCNEESCSEIYYDDQDNIYCVICLPPQSPVQGGGGDPHDCHLSGDRQGNVPLPRLETYNLGCGTHGNAGRDFDYVTGRLASASHCQEPLLDHAIGTFFENEVIFRFGYDSRGRLASLERDVDPDLLEHTTTILEFDAQDRPLRVRGPDGRNLTLTYDPLGRPATAALDSLSAAFEYDAAGRLVLTTYGNGARELRSYDAIDRIKSIEHASGPATLLRLDYQWTLNNWLSSRTETTPGGVAVTDFEYDDRGRLTRERRLDTPPGGSPATTYDWRYAYDPLGNRTRLDDLRTGDYTLYYYDVDPAYAGQRLPNCPDPNGQPGEPNSAPIVRTHNNRLVRTEYYEQVAPPASGQPATHALRRTVQYLYYPSGNTSNISVIDETTDELGRQWACDLAFGYFGNGLVRTALKSRWQLDEHGQPIPQTVEALGAREFRWDSATALTAVIDYETPDVDPLTWRLPSAGGGITQTVRIGDHAYADRVVNPVRVEGEIDSWALATRDRYFDSVGRVSSAGAISYHHHDLIGSTTAITGAGTSLPPDPNAPQGGVGLPPVLARLAYTAFGVPIAVDQGGLLGAGGGHASPASVSADPPAGMPRYQYAGAWSYGSSLLEVQGLDSSLPPVRLLHVGWRWYQPDIGRFIQRDPIGIRGGRNTYAYVGNAPTAAVDALGLCGHRFDLDQLNEQIRRAEAAQEPASLPGINGTIFMGMAAGGGWNPLDLIRQLELKNKELRRALQDLQMARRKYPRQEQDFRDQIRQIARERNTLFRNLWGRLNFPTFFCFGLDLYYYADNEYQRQLSAPPQYD